MNRSTSSKLPADLAQAARRFQSWRSSRKGKARIPDALWSLAATLAAKHGLAKTASLLRLDYYALKKQMAAQQDPPPQQLAFVELPLPPVTAAQCRIELRDQHGACMRLSLQGYNVAEVAQLGRTFWEAQQCCKSLPK